MKLYTEEQVRNALKDAMLRGMRKPSKYESIVELMINDLTPIELPSDEEISEVAMVVYGFDARDIKDVFECLVFKRGAKYVINKIKGGNK